MYITILEPTQLFKTCKCYLRYRLNFGNNQIMVYIGILYIQKLISIKFNDLYFNPNDSLNFVLFSWFQNIMVKL